MAELPITVLMPVHNSEKYLLDAVGSILAQTWQDFELLIIDDGSTDRTRELLAGIVDPRVRVVRTENRGLAAALRLGVELARGDYIARMDQDDESLPERLRVQKECLDRNPGVAVVHSFAESMDAYGRRQKGRIGTSGSNIVTKWLLIWQNVLLHPTVMIRAPVLREHGLNYRVEFNRAEDFDLWNRIAMVGDFYLIPRVLLRYRIHAESMTWRNRPDEQFVPYREVVFQNASRYGVRVSRELVDELAVISGGTRVNPVSYRYRSLHGCLHRLVDEFTARFCERFGTDGSELSQIQAEQFVRWARYMLNTSRCYTVKLLWLSAGRRKRVLLSYLFWAALAGVLLPSRWRGWIEELRARS